MKKTVYILLLFWLLLIAILIAIKLYWCVEFYSTYEKLRTGFFTGFLTLGGFILSLKTSILFHVKREVYEHPDYDAIFQKNKAVNPNLKKYTPFTNLGGLLLYSVLFSFVTSFSQVTLGLFENDYTSIICISIALTTFALIVVLWFQVKKNINHWFDILNK